MDTTARLEESEVTRISITALDRLTRMPTYSIDAVGWFSDACMLLATCYSGIPCPEDGSVYFLDYLASTQLVLAV